MMVGRLIASVNPSSSFPSDKVTFMKLLSSLALPVDDKAKEEWKRKPWRRYKPRWPENVHLEARSAKAGNDNKHVVGFYGEWGTVAQLAEAGQDLVWA